MPAKASRSMSPAVTSNGTLTTPDPPICSASRDVACAVPTVQIRTTCAVVREKYTLAWAVSEVDGPLKGRRRFGSIQGRLPV